MALAVFVDEGDVEFLAGPGFVEMAVLEDR